MSIPPIICSDENCDIHGCIFCRIIKREEPARIVAETDRALAIFPLRMATFGHTILFPKNHVRDLFDARWEDLSDAMWLAKTVSKQLQDTLKCEGMNLIQSSGSCATQTVWHIHFHLIPRNTDDRFGRMWPRSEKHEDRRLDNLLAGLRSRLPADIAT